jgi:hypothetical protein
LPTRSSAFPVQGSRRNLAGAPSISNRSSMSGLSLFRPGCPALSDPGAASDTTRRGQQSASAEPAGSGVPERRNTFTGTHAPDRRFEGAVDRWTKARTP